MGRRTLAASSLAVLAAAAVAVGPADAQEPAPLPFGAHRAVADAAALDLDLVGNRLALGLSQASTDASPRAAARGVGALLPDGAGNVSELAVEVTTDGQANGSDTQTCGEITLPADVPVVDLATACSSALAGITGGNPGGRATAGVAELAVSATELLGDTPLAEVPVQGTVDDLLAGLAPVFEGVGALGLDAESLVRDLLDGITQGGEVLAVDLGPTAASTTTDAASSAATGTAQGAVIRVIDRALLQLPPVLTIEVGAATATVRADRATGEAVPTVDPALVRVTVAPDIAAILGLPADPITVPVGQDLCLPLPPPLQSCIRAASGRSVDTADGGKRAEAEAVRIDLLTGLPDGGITLALAGTSAEAAAGAPVAPPPSETPRGAELARTGGDTGLWVPLVLAIAGAAGLVTAGATRRRNTLTP